jgi:hypothetical protein
MMSSAAVTGALGGSVTGSTIMPDCDRFTLSTSVTWSTMERFRWMNPMPPRRARAMASVASVTVSIGADTTGMASSMRGVSRVRVDTSDGRTDDSAGSRRTSSNVSPCLANLGGYPEERPSSSEKGLGGGRSISGLLVAVVRSSLPIPPGP